MGSTPRRLLVGAVLLAGSVALGLVVAVSLFLNSSRTVVLVGHDSVNRALLLQLLDQPLSAYWRLSQDPCTLNEIEVSAAGDVRVDRINDTSHLG